MNATTMYYNKAFEQYIRNTASVHTNRDLEEAYREDSDSYAFPQGFRGDYTGALAEENLFRRRATVMDTSPGDMKIQTVEWSVYIQRLDSRSYEACTLGWASNFDPDPYQIWHSSQIEGEGSNHIGYCNPKLDTMIEELRATFDMDKRIEYTRSIARLLHEEQPYTFLFWSYSLTAISGRYRNLRMFPGGIEEQILWVPRGEQLRVPGVSSL